MKLKDILAKVKKGEALTDEEKTFLDSYDPDEALSSAATAARRKAEADAAKAAADLKATQDKLAEMQAQLEEAGSKGKTESQKLQEQVAKLTKQFEQASTEKAQLVRQQKLDDVIRQSGLQFVKEVDGMIMRNALVSEFAALSDDELADKDRIKPVVETFRARNKAVILDQGHGSGSPAHQPNVPRGVDGKPVSEMTPAERAADLKKAGLI
jgi:DNA repair exonuclease SbcCD ATPase subunit